MNFLNPTELPPTLSNCNVIRLHYGIYVSISGEKSFKKPLTGSTKAPRPLRIIGRRGIGLIGIVDNTFCC